MQASSAPITFPMITYVTLPEATTKITQLLDRVKAKKSSSPKTDKRSITSLPQTAIEHPAPLDNMQTSSPFQTTSTIHYPTIS
jgi:hypothetical protein